jgi:hypothetical protein
MSRNERQRLDDILVAVDAIRAHLERRDLSEGSCSTRCGFA